ncbi:MULTISPECIES: crotonase/enoyl-CoA hydratase family protein [unclassified Arthrobacter]|uniref:crotonase/enoyl-CoA hydratase family protein n=1 Tax=unclassified Arthrobacter TaxID=235627 RepID=UPI00159EB1A1|nr:MULTISPECIES: crotonase/enoyl-CoA hydratase family protein [unclassified Arthrobacter]MCQ9163100.1 crotonase/enoyl-CoA hydratase family protein [Arthrobacter sp. STN4]NVM97555.1 crotonase/enoyl-CoA hydratase family protein [Arthrobacter sp. SDTb3-6]
MAGAPAGTAFTTAWKAFTAEQAPVPGTAVVRLAGPGRGNMMGLDFWEELPRLFAALDADEAVRAVVLTGTGNHFSVGLDVQEVLGPWLAELGAAGGPTAAARSALLRQIGRLQDGVTAVAACRKPVIAAVSGWCIGGGVDLISAADVRLASAEAKFSIREARLAIVADVGSLQRLRGVIGEGHLRELALTGKDIAADRAEKIGLVNDVHPNADSLLAAALDLAGQMAANSPLAVAGTKAVLNEDREERIARGLRHVALWNSAFLHSGDLVEAVAALGERRPAEFKGR